MLPPDVGLTLCLLSPNAAALRERILARGWDQEEADDAVAEDAILRRAAFVDTVIEAAGLSVADTVKHLRAFAGAAEPPGEASGSLVRSAADMGVVVVTGPRAAGSSTVGFRLAMGRWRAGRRTGFVDLQQLGFTSGRDAPGITETALAIDQLATMHTLLAARGAELLIVSGHLGVADRTTLRATLPSAQVTIVRLRADAATLEEHVRARVASGEARLAATTSSAPAAGTKPSSSPPR